MLTAAELKRLLAAQHLRLTKRLGQHHLVDRRMIERIVASCALRGDDTVVEIGAGLGALTEPLAERARSVIAVEVDRGIAEALRQRLHRSSVTILCADILKIPWSSWKDVVVIGAIPYHITSDIFVRLCEQRRRIKRAVLIVQQEVARRLAARPGAKAYGRLSVLAQYNWQVAVLFRVPRQAFFPQPTVDSACVRCEPHQAPPVDVADECLFFDVVKAAFAHRRKTLLNSLCESSLGLTRTEVGVLLRQAGLSPTIRGEVLGLEGFAQLANRISHSA